MMTKERRAELEALADKDPHMCLLRELLNEIAELEAQVAHAIPSDRVLEDGMVAMSAIKRKCQNDDEDAIETLALCGYGEQAELLEAAIRANQGGAAT